MKRCGNGPNNRPVILQITEVMKLPARNSTNFRTQRTFLEVKTLFREKEQRMPKDFKAKFKYLVESRKKFHNSFPH